MTADEASALDRADPLAFARDRFQLPANMIYLDGNSLGALPRAAPATIRDTVERQWGEDLIASWNANGWIDAPERLAAKLAPIVGAAPHELLVADSTSVSLFKLLAAAVRARPGRTAILTEHGNFPSDLYVAEGLAEMMPGLRVERVDPGSILSAIGEDTAVVMLTQVDYRSGRRFDMAAINAAARAAGALTLWDLSHSAGAIALEVAASGCDLAVGCGYKYLNGGPGAPAFLFVAERLQQELRSPIPGWMGHSAPFAIEADFVPQAGIGRFLTGTPSILALAALDAGLDAFAGVAMGELEAKSAQLTQVFIDQVEQSCGGEVRLDSPRDPARRGSHVSFAHPQGYAVMQALIARGVVGDFRQPDLMRFGFAPLYNRFEETWLAAQALAEVLESREWDDPSFRQQARVT